MMFWTLWRSLWDELNAPDRFHGQPYYGLINQIGHIWLGEKAVQSLCSLWVKLIDPPAPVWPLAAMVVMAYILGVELFRQKWFGSDTINDSAFLAIGAVGTAMTMVLTPSGRWVRVDEASSAFMVWLAFAVLALALYVWPRLVAASGGEK